MPPPSTAVKKHSATQELAAGHCAAPTPAPCLLLPAAPATRAQARGHAAMATDGRLIIDFDRDYDAEEQEDVGQPQYARAGTASHAPSVSSISSNDFCQASAWMSARMSALILQPGSGALVALLQPSSSSCTTFSQLSFTLAT